MNTNLLRLDALTTQAENLCDRTVDDRNMERRMPAYILVDNSGSLSGYEDVMKQAVHDLYRAILDNAEAARATELGVLRFNSVVEIMQAPCEIKRQEAQGANLDFHCEGATYTGLALKTALVQIEERLQTYKAHMPRIHYNAPILFLLTDGKPECYDEDVKPAELQAMTQAKAEIKAKVAANELSVIAVEIGKSCDHNLLRELTGLNDDRHVFKVTDKEKLADAFKFTSTLIIHASKKKKIDLNQVDIRRGV